MRPMFQLNRSHLLHQPSFSAGAFSSLISSAATASHGVASPPPGALKLLERLQTMREFDPAVMRTPLENRMRKVGEGALWLSGALMVLTVLLVAPAFFVDGLKSVRSYGNAVMILAGLSMLVPTVWMTVDVLVGMWSMLKLGSRLARQELAEAQHDFAHVSLLMDEEDEFLAECAGWLDIKMGRIHARIALFFGSLDKLALFSLAGLGWSAWSVFKDNQVANWQAMLVQWGLALLGGLALAGLALRQRVLRLAYYRELLTLVKARKDRSRLISPRCPPQLRTVRRRFGS